MPQLSAIHSIETIICLGRNYCAVKDDGQKITGAKRVFLIKRKSFTASSGKLK
uniref:Uncharacterized protein n=1 Tax=uncultured Desulfobacterium sp. TaxID=201089 RepID=E1YDA0_9BACT|nr:unknown protein [uncultured Desulfobacterium sp.]